MTNVVHATRLCHASLLLWNKPARESQFALSSVTCSTAHYSSENWYISSSGSQLTAFVVCSFFCSAAMCLHNTANSRIRQKTFHFGREPWSDSERETSAGGSGIYSFWHQKHYAVRLLPRKNWLWSKGKQGPSSNVGSRSEEPGVCAGDQETHLLHTIKKSHGRRLRLPMLKSMWKENPCGMTFARHLSSLTTTTATLWSVADRI